MQKWCSCPRRSAQQSSGLKTGATADVFPHEATDSITSRDGLVRYTAPLIAGNISGMVRPMIWYASSIDTLAWSRSLMRVSATVSWTCARMRSAMLLYACAIMPNSSSPRACTRRVKSPRARAVDASATSRMEAATPDHMTKATMRSSTRSNGAPVAASFA